MPKASFEEQIAIPCVDCGAKPDRLCKYADERLRQRVHDSRRARAEAILADKVRRGKKARS